MRDKEVDYDAVQRDKQKAMLSGVIHQLKENSLAVLDLSDYKNKISPFGVEILAPYLPLCQQLAVLNILYVTTSTIQGLAEYGSIGAYALGKHLPACHLLEHVSLGIDVNGGDLLYSLPKLKSLRFLILGDIDEGLSSGLAYVLSECKALTVLKFRESISSSIDIEDLAVGFSKCKVLRHLEMGMSKIESEKTGALFSALANCNLLENLSLSYLPLKITDIQILSEILPRFESLTSLDLAGAEIDNEGIAVLAPVLPLCKSLRYLNLGSNKIGKEGFQILARFLPECQLLHHLNLRDNAEKNIEVMRELIVTLPLCKSLGVLVLGDIQETIEFNAAKLFAEMLLHCSKLITLEVSLTVNSENIKQFLKVLPECKLLLNLDLNYENAGVEGEITRLLEHNRRLCVEFLSAAAEGDMRLLRDCVARGASIWWHSYYMCHYSEWTEHTGTAFHTAARRGHLEVVKYFVEQGLPASVLDYEDETAEEVAVLSNQRAVVEYLKTVSRRIPQKNPEAAVDYSQGSPRLYKHPSAQDKKDSQGDISISPRMTKVASTQNGNGN